MSRTTAAISVLLVEDEVMISNLVAARLSESGFRVHEVATADDALYSVGAGAELHTDITTLGDTSVRFDWAHPVGSYNANNISSDTFYVQLLQDF